MKWFTIHGSLRDHRKWLALGPIERGAWISLMLIGHTGEPRWQLGDRETVILLLRRDGFEDPGPVLDRLLAVQVLDEFDGLIGIHDADDWQRKPSDAPEAVKKRVQKHRAPRGDTTGNAEQRGETPTGQDRQTEEEEEEEAAPPHPPPMKLGNLYEAYADLTRKECDPRMRAWIDDLVAEVGGREVVGRAMYADPHPRRGNLLGRVTHVLRDAAAS